jgi:hypothetical protein
MAYGHVPAGKAAVHASVGGARVESGWALRAQLRESRLRRGGFSCRAALIAVAAAAVGKSAVEFGAGSGEAEGNLGAATVSGTDKLKGAITVGEA